MSKFLSRMAIELCEVAWESDRLSALPCAAVRSSATVVCTFGLSVLGARCSPCCRLVCGEPLPPPASGSRRRYEQFLHAVLLQSWKYVLLCLVLCRAAKRLGHTARKTLSESIKYSSSRFSWRSLWSSPPPPAPAAARHAPKSLQTRVLACDSKQRCRAARRSRAACAHVLMQHKRVGLMADHVQASKVLENMASTTASATATRLPSREY